MAMPKTLAKTKLWRYEVDEVWGFEDQDKPPVAVGTVLIDRWKSDRCWMVFDMKSSKEVGGWHAKLLGAYDGPRDRNGYPTSEGGRDG